MNKRRYSNRRRTNMLRVFILLMTIIITVVMWRTIKLTELSNGKKVDSRIYPELQQMFNDARAEGLALFVREGYRTTEEQQKIMDKKINEYEKQGYSAKEAKKRAEKYVAIPDTSEHQYVGTTVAKIMKEENLCLEEYLEKYK